MSYRYPGEERDKASRETTARQREWGAETATGQRPESAELGA